MNATLLCMALGLAATPDAADEVLSTLAPTDGGLTIDDVVKRAVDTSPSAMKARSAYDKANSDSDSAYLGYVPRVDLSAGFALQTKIEPSPMFPIEIPPTSTSFVASMSVPVSDYFLRIAQGYDAVKTGRVVARYQLHAARETVAIQAIQTFLDTIRARAAALVTRQSVDVLTEQLTDIMRLAEAGLSTQGDVLQVQAQVASAKVGLARAEGAQRVAEAALRRTLHDDEINLASAEDLLGAVGAPVPEPNEALSIALERRAELASLRELMDVQEELAKIERAGLFPRLTLDGNIMHAKPNQQAFDFQQFRTTWQIGINLRWSPNDAVSAWSNWNKAEEDVAIVNADLLALSDAITIEVTTAVNAIRTARESIVAAKEGLEAANGAFVDRQNLLAAGSGTTRELLLAEQDLRNAQLQIINAHLDLRLANAQFERATGRLRQGDDQ